ncbi:hypothetical protein [Streptomyces yanii]|uniref:Uncharacterized protein n=1 Tax=Streptomyces yanii TaxID=78510 RepID=A0ABV5R0N2_9ACTN
MSNALALVRLLLPVSDRDKDIEILAGTVVELVGDGVEVGLAERAEIR